MDCACAPIIALGVSSTKVSSGSLYRMQITISLYYS